jgi:outer membrane receptor protein involved in Fe transport
MADQSICRHRALLASCAVLAVAAAMPAWAADSHAANVEEVVVTAQKRTENIQNEPAAVSVLGDKALDELHATQLADIGSYVPALQINSGGTPGQTSISIRGIAPVGPGATVATYIDDSPIGSSSAYGGGIIFALDLLPYDVQRLEVLRGPQGTLYGASSMGGLLKYVLTTPSLDRFEGEVGGDLFGLSGAGGVGAGARARISAPIVRDKLAMTASYAVEDTPGFIDNSVSGEKDQNGFRQESARLGFYWRPTDDLSVKLNAMYQRVDADGNANVALDSATLQPLDGRRRDNNLTDQPFEKRIHYVSLGVEDSLPWAELVSASSFTNTWTSQIQDASYTYGVAFPFFGLPAGASQYHYDLHLEKYTQELRLQSHASARLEWLAGVFATYERSSNRQSPSALTIDGTPIPGLDPLFEGQLPSTYTEYAAFGDLTWHLTDRFELLGGLRYSENHQVFSEFGGGSIIAPINLLDQKSKEDVVTYSAGAKYRFTDRVMGYVRVASGYQPGGPNLAGPGIPPTFGSDTLTNYEVGLKSQLLDNRLLLNVDAFYIKWNDIQLLSNGAGFSHGVNGGTARSQGVEGDLTLRPLDGLTLEAAFAYVDATLTEDIPEIGGLSGDRLPNIPQLSGSLRATYTRPINADWAASIGAGWRVQSRRYSSVNHAYDSRPIPGYGAVDLNASLSNDRYTVRLFAKNVTDKHAYLSYQPLVNQATGAITQIEGTVLQPRVIGIAVDAKF